MGVMDPDVLKDRSVLLGVTGSIAAYKAVLLLRALTAAGARVSVVMTRSARRFVAPLTFEALSGRRVPNGLFSGDVALQHLDLAEQSDLILIAPATANTIGKMANGVADDLLTTLVSATRSPVVVCPAMDGYMWEHPVLKRNVSTLEGLGYTIVPPEEGPLASGKSGVGRLASEDAILSAARRRLSVARDLTEEVILVTAGPTREPIDPVRYISNRSSGKMGYAIAHAAVDRGARVILVSGPTSLAASARAEFIRVESSQEMRDSVLRLAPESSVVVMAAAVSDYRVRTVSSEKIKKSEGPRLLELEPTGDILRELSDQPPSGGRPRLLIGFAAETQNLLEGARAKLEAKRLDLIVANDVTVEGAGFDSDTNRVTLLGRDGGPEALPMLSKRAVADRLLDRVRLLREAAGGKAGRRPGDKTRVRD